MDKQLLKYQKIFKVTPEIIDEIFDKFYIFQYTS